MGKIAKCDHARNLPLQNREGYGIARVTADIAQKFSISGLIRKTGPLSCLFTTF